MLYEVMCGGRTVRAMHAVRGSAACTEHTKMKRLHREMLLQNPSEEEKGVFWLHSDER